MSFLHFLFFFHDNEGLPGWGYGTEWDWDGYDTLCMACITAFT
jgi:hypothetical protein